MFSDSQTNQLYLADCLQKKQPKFFQRFEKVLTDCSVKYKLLSSTKDIWIADFMPVQVRENKFVQFSYNSGYLHKLKLLDTRSDVDSICKTIEIIPEKTDIILDGGNVVRTSDKVIISNIIFKDNPNITDKELIKKLEKIFEVDKIIFVPQDKSDSAGHSDGMVRFLDDRTVLINDFSKEELEFQSCFRMSLHNSGLDWIEIPYHPYDNKNSVNATGTYINFIQMKDIIIVPIFRAKQDEEAVKLFEQCFRGKTVVTVESNEIAKQGGVLHCISWNIKA